MKNILITGTSRGIGLELVKNLAYSGNKILAISRTIADELSFLPNVTCISADLSVSSDLEKIADSILFIEDGQILFHKQKDDIFSDYVVWQGTKEELKKLHDFAIVSELPSAFGRKVLFDKQKLLKSGAFERYAGLDAPTLEEFLLFLQAK